MSVVDLTDSIATQKVAICNPDGTSPALVAVSGAAPTGATTWTRTAVTLTGSSQTALAANASRKGLIVSNRVGNAQVSYDISGAAVTLIAGLPLAAGLRDAYTGTSTPLTAITVIGTAAQLMDVWEGT